MQHKRKQHRTGVLAGVFIVIIVGCVWILMTQDIKPTQQLVEKQLDASAFLQSKQ